MKILVALPTNSLDHHSIDAILDGTEGCSGTNGSFIRLADFLAAAGEDVHLAASAVIPCTRFPCIDQRNIDPREYDALILHQSHWDGKQLSLGNASLPKTYLWLQNQTPWMFVHSFLRSGGRHAVCPSFHHAGLYRALPGWPQRISTIYNSYCPAFRPLPVPPQRRLLFIGAISRDKGFDKLTTLWSSLAARGVDLQLTVAGSVSLHVGGQNALGTLGIATPDFEATIIEPWLAGLPPRYRPCFLGAVSPTVLREEIAQSMAVVVNPSCVNPETFCVAAVEAQACDRSVFSVAAGALGETVYQGDFSTLAPGCEPEMLANLIARHLSGDGTLLQNGQSAGEYVRRKFADEAVLAQWRRLLCGQPVNPEQAHDRHSSRDAICDLLRWSRTGLIYAKYFQD